MNIQLTLGHWVKKMILVCVFLPMHTVMPESRCLAWNPGPILSHLCDFEQGVKLSGPQQIHLGIE